MIVPQLSAELTPQTQYRQIIAQNAYPASNLSPEQQRAYVNRYSFGALVFNFIYYFAMEDSPLAWLSLFCTIFFVFLPVIFILPLFARRRAWARRQWLNFDHFHTTQKQWDRWGWSMLIFTIALIGLSLWIIGPMILRSVQNLTGQSGTTNFTQQLRVAVKQYQDILGR